MKYVVTWKQLKGGATPLICASGELKRVSSHGCISRRREILLEWSRRKFLEIDMTHFRPRWLTLARLRLVLGLEGVVELKLSTGPANRRWIRRLIQRQMRRQRRTKKKSPSWIPCHQIDAESHRWMRIWIPSKKKQIAQRKYVPTQSLMLPTLEPASPCTDLAFNFEIWLARWWLWRKKCELLLRGFIRGLSLLIFVLTNNNLFHALTKY